MDYYSGYINQLIEQLSHLPGIGVKTAQRLAFHIMNMPADQAKRLADSITEAKSHVQYCKCCQTLTDKELCDLCQCQARSQRDHGGGDDAGPCGVRENRKIRRCLPRPARGNLPNAGNRAGRHPVKRADAAPPGRCLGGYRCHELQPGGRDNGHVHQQADQADRHQGDADCKRCSGGRRSGKY